MSYVHALKIENNDRYKSSCIFVEASKELAHMHGS
jgi:hypothetical protein